MTSGSGDRTDAPARLEAFLSAGLAEEPNGMTLSVVSAFARLDLDPYRAAGGPAAPRRRDIARPACRAAASLRGHPSTTLISRR